MKILNNRFLRNSLLWLLIIAAFLIIAVFAVYSYDTGNNTNETVAEEDSTSYMLVEDLSYYYEKPLYVNSVMAHNEQDTIVGNFTGHGIDTLFVEAICEDRYTMEPVDTTESVDLNDEPCRFYLSSNNKRIPTIEIYGTWYDPPKLVNEGDLDGNGTCEVGYLETWTWSQWRSYYLFTLVGNEWRYLVDGEILFTNLTLRGSGLEIAEPGKEKGTILIHYIHQGPDKVTGEPSEEIRDTIVKPTFDKIEE